MFASSQPNLSHGDEASIRNAECINLALRQVTRIAVRVAIDISFHFRTIPSLPFLAYLRWANIEGWARFLLEEEETVVAMGLLAESQIALIW
jgi:hypothetical protein